MKTLPATKVQEVEEILREAGLLHPTELLPVTLTGTVKLTSAQREFLVDHAQKLLIELRRKEELRTLEIRNRAEAKRERRAKLRLQHANS